MAAGDYTGTYDPTKVIVSIGGVTVTGWTDGDFITARRSSDSYTKKVGADGEVSRAKNADRTGEIELKLSQTSKANDELSALFNLQLLGGSDTTFPIGIADLSGRTVLAAAQCWLRTAPELTFGMEVGERVWMFDTASLIYQVGGNN